MSLPSKTKVLDNGIFVCRPVCNAAEVMQIIGSVLKLRAHCPTMIHASSSRSHLIVTLTISSKSPNAAVLGEHAHTIVGGTPGGQSLCVHPARRLQSAKKEMQHSTKKQWWSPRCRRTSPHACNSFDEPSASPASSPSPSPCHSPCPSPSPGLSQALFRTKLQLVDLAGSECAGETVSPSCLIC